MRLAIVHDTLQYVRSYGHFVGAPTVQSFERIEQLGPGARVLTVPLHHQGVVGGQFVELSPAQQAAADDDVEDRQDADGSGALDLRIVRTPARLPVPPPRPGMLVLVMNAGAGNRALAVSDRTGWDLFPADPGARVP